MLGTILLIVLILLLLGAIPAWPHSRSWGYYPSGFVGILLYSLVMGAAAYIAEPPVPTAEHVFHEHPKEKPPLGISSAGSYEAMIPSGL